MNIQLNEQPLDVTIAEGETLGQVVRDLESWLQGTDLVLCSVLRGGQELLCRPEEEWAAIPQAQVDTLRVTVRPARELAIRNLEAVAEYLDLVAGRLDEQQALPRELVGGFPAMSQSFLRHFPDGKAAIQALESFVVGADGGASGSPAALVQRLRERVALRLAEVSDPPEAMRVLGRSLERCIGEISEVSILLQTGRNRQAMEVMVRFSELSQELVRMIGRHLGDSSIDGRRPAEFFAELNGVLGELIEAFDARDSVLIGDLMEYEVAPRLQTLRAFLHEHGAEA